MENFDKTVIKTLGINDPSLVEGINKANGSEAASTEKKPNNEAANTEKKPNNEAVSTQEKTNEEEEGGEELLKYAEIKKPSATKK